MITDNNSSTRQPALRWIDLAQPGIDTKKGRNLMDASLKTTAIGAIVMTTGLLSPLTTGAHAPARGAAAPICQATQLAISPDLSSAATGHAALELRLHNVSAQACTLHGYPTVVLLDRARQPLQTVLHWGPGGFFNFNRPVRQVTFTPGGSAYVALGWTHFPTPGRSCPPAPTLVVLPPGASSALVVALVHGSVDACGGQLAVSAVEPTHFVL